MGGEKSWASSEGGVLGLSDSGSSELGSPTSQSEPVQETPILSLRRIAPPGFLTQSFAGESSGCTS